MRPNKRPSSTRATPARRGPAQLERGRAGRLLAPPAPAPARLAELVNAYLGELLAGGYRPRTVSTYKKALTRCAPLWPKCKDAGALLVALAELAPATRALYLTAVRTFEAWAVRGGYLERARFDGPTRVKLDQAAPRPIAAADLAKLDRAAQIAGGRLELLYLLMRETGCRIGEALGLKWPDVILEPGREGLRLRSTKGRADRFVPMMPGRLLARLRRTSTGQRDAVLGRGERHVLEPAMWPPRGLGYDAALTDFHRLCTVAGVKATPHQLRHTKATELHGDGLSAHALQRFMGWARLDHAARYVQVTDEDLRGELRRVAGDTTPRPSRRRR